MSVYLKCVFIENPRVSIVMTMAALVCINAWFGCQQSSCDQPLTSEGRQGQCGPAGQAQGPGVSRATSGTQSDPLGK